MPQTQVKITYFKSPSDKDINFLSQGISSEALKKKGLKPPEYFAFLALDEKKNA